jgi:hypothetical protein
MTLRYEIDSDNAVRVFYPDSDLPFLYQPTWPNGDAWINSEQSSAWANLYIESIDNESAPYAPDEPGKVGRPKPTAEQIEKLEAARTLTQSATTPEEQKAAMEELQAAYESIQ